MKRTWRGSWPRKACSSMISSASRACAFWKIPSTTPMLSSNINRGAPPCTAAPYIIHWLYLKIEEWHSSCLRLYLHAWGQSEEGPDKHFFNHDCRGAKYESRRVHRIEIFRCRCCCCCWQVGPPARGSDSLLYPVHREESVGWRWWSLWACSE